MNVFGSLLQAASTLVLVEAVLFGFICLWRDEGAISGSLEDNTIGLELGLLISFGASTRRFHKRQVVMARGRAVLIGGDC